MPDAPRYDLDQHRRTMVPSGIPEKERIDILLDIFFIESGMNVPGTPGGTVHCGGTSYFYVAKRTQYETFSAGGKIRNFNAPENRVLKSGYRRIMGPELAQRKAERRHREKNKNTALTPEIRDLV